MAGNRKSLAGTPRRSAEDILGHVFEEEFTQIGGIPVRSSCSSGPRTTSICGGAHGAGVPLPTVRTLNCPGTVPIE